MSEGRLVARILDRHSGDAGSSPVSRSSDYARGQRDTGTNSRAPVQKQARLFSIYSGMSLMDMWKECGRIRRMFYAKQMAYAAAEELKKKSGTDSQDGKASACKAENT